MYFELGNCRKHGAKQVFATPPNSQFAVCVRCATEFFIGHNLRQLIREALCKAIADTVSVTAPSV